MSDTFILHITTNPKEYKAQLVLKNNDGVFSGANEVSLLSERPSDWEGLFSMRDYAERFAGFFDPKTKKPLRTDEEIVVDLGVFLADKVLGQEIFSKLYEGINKRTLIVKLPDSADDNLAGAFARVPYEIARASKNGQSLYERNLAVRVINQMKDIKSKPVELNLEQNEPLRVLLVFAESEKSNPLALRLERERLIELFYDEILPESNVQVDVLCHGVTVDRIEEQVKSAQGYHILHWSGHGHHDVLEVYDNKGRGSVITGHELIDLFQNAGGFMPGLVFLSACHSGAMITAKNWEKLKAILQEHGDMAKPEKDGEAGGIDNVITEKNGYTGTALSLLSAGVPQVLAMRYAVGDAYARRLARRFYRRLIRDGFSPDHALAVARTEIANDSARKQEHSAVDHATPILFGQCHIELRPKQTRSKQLNKRYPSPGQTLLDTDLKKPKGFVGRSKELTRLSLQWLLKNKTPAAIIQGLGGLGKTWLAAEAVHLWHHRFDWTLAVQTRNAMSADEFYLKIHTELTMASNNYREICESNEYNQIYLDKSLKIDRYAKMCRNLTDTMRNERILLIVDNFEPNLFDDGKCKDDNLESLLEALCERLKESGSRVLITSRIKPAVLKDKALWFPLGPLSVNEARLYFQNEEHLRKLWYNRETFPLAVRVLEISRGHPLILNHLGRIAKNEKDLIKVLDKIKQQGFKDLPDLVIGAKNTKEQETEWNYLNEVSRVSIDSLIEKRSNDARFMLWILSLAQEPVEINMLNEVWEEKADALSLLTELTESGLVQAEEQVYSVHELVKERSLAWMDSHEAEKRGNTPKAVWISYGKRYENLFNHFTYLNEPGSKDTAFEMGRRALSYYIRAGELEALSGFVGRLVTSTNNPYQLKAVIAELETIVKLAPAGQMRWHIRTCLADALMNSGRISQTG
ncbi:MAG TPA: CHAT domain-containing protein, partial [Thermodesulfovibrionia bacterium]|nr:CHAT domain-containing protein [Thermodesulfovibrionia bacterium]